MSFLKQNKFLNRINHPPNTISQFQPYGNQGLMKISSFFKPSDNLGNQAYEVELLNKVKARTKMIIYRFIPMFETSLNFPTSPNSQEI